MGVASSELDVRVSRSDGPVAILTEAGRVLARQPEILGLYALLAVAAFASETIGTLLEVIAYGFAVGALYQAVDGRADPGVSFGVRIVVAVLASLISGLVMLVGLLLLVVPGIYAIVHLRFVLAAVYLEGAGPVEAQFRSLALTEGHGWTVFGVVGTLVLVKFGIAVALAVATGGLGWGTVDPAALDAATRMHQALVTLVLPVGVAADAVMYGLYETQATAGGTASSSPAADATPQ